MTFLEILNQINAGGVVAILVLILSLIEITPIKVSPLKWIGRRVNKDAIDKVEKLEKKVDDHNNNIDIQVARLETKLDEHIAEASRTKIMSFMTEIIQGKPHTEEQFDEVISASVNYENFCKENNVDNDKCNIAIAYIRSVYKKCIETGVFIPPVSPNMSTYIPNKEMIKLIDIGDDSKSKIE